MIKFTTQFTNKEETHNMNDKGSGITYYRDAIIISPLNGSKPYALKIGGRVQVINGLRYGGQEGLITGFREDPFPPHLRKQVLVRIDGTKKARRYYTFELIAIDQSLESILENIGGDEC